MTQKRKRLSGPEKIALVKRYLVERVPIADQCDAHGLLPGQISRWQAATSCEVTRCRAVEYAHGAHVMLTHAVRCVSVRTEDRAPVRTSLEPLEGPRPKDGWMPSTGAAGLSFGIGTYAINLRGRRPRLKRHGAARGSLTPCPRDSSSR
jgi:hypothetical protein